MGKIIRKAPKGFFAKTFRANPTADKFVEINWMKRIPLGRLLKKKIREIVNIPKGNKITLIENNKPKVGSITINFKKKK